ncbi:hypothetical protein Q8F55_004265 [Vanrija albida]|uniref:Ubiquitin-like domain-containing protein n=1 Tax=Vanrija albida TaxID=181172 RepID=A0ABR3Q690_9TREE
MLDDDLEDFDLTQLPSLTTVDGDDLPFPIFPHPFSRPDSSNAIYDPFWFLTAWKAFPEETVFVGALLLTDYWLAAEVLPPTLLASLKSLFQVWVADRPNRSEVHDTVKAFWSFLTTVNVSTLDRVLAKAEVCIIATSNHSGKEDEAVTKLFLHTSKVGRGVTSYVKLQNALFDLGKKKTSLKSRHGTLDEAAKAICWLLALGLKCALECHAYSSGACYCPYHAVLAQPDHESPAALNLAFTSAVRLVQDMAKAEGPEASVIPTMFQMMQIDVASALSMTFTEASSDQKIEPPLSTGLEVIVQATEDKVDEKAEEKTEEKTHTKPISVRLSISFSWLQQTIYLAANQPFRHMAETWRNIVTELAMVKVPPSYFIYIWNGRRLDMDERPLDVRMGRKANIYVLDAADVLMAPKYDYDTFREEALRAFEFRAASGFKITDRFSQTMTHLETSLKLVQLAKQRKQESPIKELSVKESPVTELPIKKSPVKESPVRSATQSPTPPILSPAAISPKAPRAPDTPKQVPPVVAPKELSSLTASPAPGSGFATPKEGEIAPGNRVRTLAARFSTISLNAAAAPLRPPQPRSVSGPPDAVTAASLRPFALSSSANSRNVSASSYGYQADTDSQPATPNIGSPAASTLSKTQSPLSSPTRPLSQTLPSTLESTASPALPVAAPPPQTFAPITPETTIPPNTRHMTTRQMTTRSTTSASKTTSASLDVKTAKPAPVPAKGRSQLKPIQLTPSTVGKPSDAPKATSLDSKSEAKSPVDGKAAWSSLKTSAGRLWKQ